MSLSRRLRALALGFGVGLAAALAGAPADAVEAPPGSKNFTPPTGVPNYFSNESGPFHSGGATTRAAQPAEVPVAIAPAVHDGRALASRRTPGRHHPAHLGKAGGHTRVAHGKESGHRQVAHASAARRGHSPEQKVVHAAGPKVAHAVGTKIAHAAASKSAHAAAGHLAGKTVAAKSRAASSKGKHPARAHG